MGDEADEVSRKQHTTRLGTYTIVACTPSAARRDGDVVVLLGWYGARDAHLEKYARMHHAQGRATVRTVAPTGDVILKTRATLDKVAADCLDVADALRRPGGRVILHCFSNGGAFVYEAYLRQSEALPEVHAAIFDSCPAYMWPETALRVITAYTSNRAGRAALACTFRAWVAVARAVERLLGTPPPPKLFWDAMLNDASRIPSLYLYSHADEITDAGKLEELIAVRRARGDTEVRTEVFEGTAHVLHYRGAPDKYAAAVQAFLEREPDKAATMRCAG